MEDTLGVVVVFLLYRQAEKVLILVLMEDTLGEMGKQCYEYKESKVLILVLMEDTLGELVAFVKSFSKTVLILVLMEDTLGDSIMNIKKIKDFSCLNPCSNGRYSRSVCDRVLIVSTKS